MTFGERVEALEPLGFSHRQTEFLVTVALHSGFCLRRHYMAFAGLKYGAGVRDFLDRLVARGLARRSQFRADRGHVYHLHNTHIYAAINQDDNRNRRRTSPALIARKLMLLDYVLGEPNADWYATEQDKVALFTTGSASHRQTCHGACTSHAAPVTPTPAATSSTRCRFAWWTERHSSRSFSW